MPRPRMFCVARRIATRLAGAAYLAALGVFLVLSLLGDSLLSPLSYFFTWDMFPAHYTESSKRVAVGVTVSGRHLQLHPAPYQQFYGGVYGDLTRVELERQGLYYLAAVDQTLKLKAAEESHDPITHVYLFERYWPAKFNYPADIYKAWSGIEKPGRPPAEPNAAHTAGREGRSAWRLVGEFDVGRPAPAENERENLRRGDRP